MTVLSSRGSVSPDLTELISKAGVVVHVTEDRSVDPAELRIVQEAVWPWPEETLLIKSVKDGITLMDLIRVIDRLGFPVHYEELK